MNTARRELVLATRNAHKVREFAGLLDGWTVQPLPEDVELPPETATDFAGNALIKAHAACRATGKSSIADDSGIVAFGLGGAPGVRSARYAGETATDEQNLHKLLAELSGNPDRAVEYVCVIAMVEPDGGEQMYTGRCSGIAIDTPRGHGGFGYDPIFVPDDLDDDRTMAELSALEKDAISHRGRAARALLAALEEDS